MSIQWILCLGVKCTTYIRGYRIFQTSRYQGTVKAAVSGVLEDLKFKSLKSAKMRQPGQTQDNFNFGLSLQKI